ncbi:hypothetical protein GBL98_20730 [Yersinia pseudotuberculosis]|uniref:hypothetical protein n=1 Tax=Yersinia pseudotuberculosis TaxID=633 RepID=UPI0005E78B37|nr:hypothetical protein [Yersinia pseudotuberculosis]AYX15470.1 hypothetical protein EGX44_09845 [Yersinia pseudotuberculosis]MBO1609281.1 hypothetical protein [Yersinia pseudotuberculosis]MBO1613375.1 hypothetical protein [Yersinia pseudotuberculosis]MBO1623496.1 hypothetical protein [Yersinia pseudotuberculosis]CFR01110.1 Uncharacterised protein [Yersinia pseudotuberculosis]
MLSKEELQHIVLAKQNGWAEFYPVGRDAEMAEELLSLREQLAALKALEPFCHVFLHPDGPLFNGIVSDSCAGHAGVIPLFTAAKPAED